MRIVLKTASQIPYGVGLLRPTGTVAEVSEDEADVLAGLGRLVTEEERADSVEETHEEDATTGDNDTADEQADPVEETLEEKPTLGLTRPKMAASIAVWREYAQSLSIKTTGLKKQEIIGAVDSLES